MFGLVKTLKTAAHDPRIKAVIMDFDGPALSMAATMEVKGDWCTVAVCGIMEFWALTPPFPARVPSEPYRR